jgi:dihydroxyacetone kinase-like protein
MKTQDIIAAAEAVHAAILANEQQIESLDRAIGDGDHFINVRRGCEAIAAIKPDLGPLAPAQAFHRIGM